MASSAKHVVPLTREIIVGWPETFNLGDDCSESIEATTIFSNVPARGFAFIEKFTSAQGERFQLLDVLGFPTFGLPGEPIDMMNFCNGARLNGLRIGPGSGVLLRVRYTGLVPERLRAGEKRRLTIMFIANMPAEL